MADPRQLFAGKGLVTFVAMLGLWSGAALAQSIDVPDGCEPLVTVHKDSCAASTYFQCDDRIEVLTYENDRLTDTHVFGLDWDVLAYYADDGRMGVEAVEGSAPEASLKAALQSGESVGSREMHFASGVLKGETATMDSKLVMTDETVELGGETLRVGVVTRLFTIQKNGVTTQYDFDIFATEDAALMIEGAAEVDQFGRKSRLEHKPLGLSRPGEPGYLATRSAIACD